MRQPVVSSFGVTASQLSELWVGQEHLLREPPILNATTQTSTATRHAMAGVQEQHLAAVADFITETGRISAQQLEWLGLLEKWLPKQQYADLDKAVEGTINANVTLLTQFVVGLWQQGMPIKIGHPLTDESVPVIGMGYSTQLTGYQVVIPAPAPERHAVVTLATTDQLHT